MAFQSPKWTHVTLPSVEGVNILRDPPKSIVTRKITKVGEDDSLLNLVDGSSDRVCEAIKIYPRGINPMVEVSYDNNSRGISGGGSSHVSRQAQAYLPYRIMDRGAFRAPIIAPQSLLPLSRLPRTHTFATANPGLVDFTKTISCGTNSKNTKGTIIQGCVEPTKFYKKEQYHELDSRSSIQNKLTSNVKSNPRGFTKIIIPENEIKLESNRPVANGYTNLSGVKTAVQTNPETTIIKRNLKYNEYESRPLMKRTMFEDDFKIVSGISGLKPGNVKTRI